VKIAIYYNQFYISLEKLDTVFQPIIEDVSDNDKEEGIS